MGKYNVIIPQSVYDRHEAAARSESTTTQWQLINKPAVAVEKSMDLPALKDAAKHRQNYYYYTEHGHLPSCYDSIISAPWLIPSVCIILIVATIPFVKKLRRHSTTKGLSRW